MGIDVIEDPRQQRQLASLWDPNETLMGLLMMPDWPFVLT